VLPYMQPMTNVPVTELTTRARGVFRLVVETYLDSGLPVGSRTLSKLRVSSGYSRQHASIILRNRW